MQGWYGASIRDDDACGSGIALNLPSAAPADAQCTGSTSLASKLGLVAQRYDRIMMVKVLDDAS